MNLDDYTNQEISIDQLNELLIEGRLKFNTKDVGNPSAVSHTESKSGNCQSPDNRESDNDKKNKQIQNMIDNVKDNEELVNTLEDFLNKMLADMNITPKSKKIADAAKLLNGNGDTNITKDTFDTAETIIENADILSKGYIPQLAPLLGDIRLESNPYDCSGISRSIMDGFTFAQLKNSDTDDNSDIVDPDDVDYDTEQNVTEIEENFAEEMKTLMAYLINKLFWNIIWGRMWTSIFDLIEKMIAKPIDTPIIIIRGLLFRIPKLTRENYYKYGPIHKALNKFKMVMLCKIPKRIWTDYKPEDDIIIYWRGSLVPLNTLCSKDFISGFDECINKPIPTPEEREQQAQDEYVEPSSDPNAKPEGDSYDADDLEDDGNGIAGAVDDAEGMPDNMDICDIIDGMGKAYDEQAKNNKKKPRMTPECLDAAHTVMKAVYNDSKYNNKRG